MGTCLPCYSLTNWRTQNGWTQKMEGHKTSGHKKAWQWFSISRGCSAPEGNTFHKSQSWVLLRTPVLPNLTAHSEWQNFDLQNFNQDAQKSPTEKCSSDNWIFLSMYCSSVRFLFPLRESVDEQDWSGFRLIKLQVQLRCSSFSFIWLPSVQHLTTRYPFLPIIWHYSSKIRQYCCSHLQMGTEITIWKWGQVLQCWKPQGFCRLPGS